MLKDFFYPQLQQFEAYNRATWFQQDGATCHTSNASLEAVNEMFAGKLISRRATINQLKTNICEEMAAIPCAMCQQVITNLRFRFGECLQRNGAHLDDVIFKK
ncbi:unnamed protein product [Pieris macdunnoughi]|uniref:Transposase n=1 Tax=Pieris macdunnoughi TaxID=345717 RepID=A0A821RV55_9NEOP|nr:unnamed protein product [Pieris macdunnoughi]